jgi:CheY-like chemotaxis protein
MQNPSTVLVAEDSPTQALQIKWLLEKAGFHVVVANDGKQALEIVRATPPAIVVTDLDMPEMNGLELVQAVRVEFPQIPLVLTTAKGSEAIAAEALRKGASSYVPKRFLDDLAPTVKRLLALVQADHANVELFACTTYHELRFRLTNDGSLVPPLIAQLRHLVQRFRIRDFNGAMLIATALEEALQNAIIHGNLEVSSKLREIDSGRGYHQLAQQRRQEEPYKNRHVDVWARLTTDSAEFQIRDEGPGFDPTTIPDPTAPDCLDKPSGRGLWLIHAFVDEVRHNDRGNEITLRLRKSPGVGKP